MPKTIRLRADDPAGIERAAAILRAGGIVAFPTETVYGLGANALNAEAVRKIFSAKQRPSWDPLITHVPDAADLAGITRIEGGLRSRVDALAESFWPGPLTLLLPRSEAVPDAVSAGRPLVGMRVPDHPVAQTLLRATGLPIAAPSANIFSHVSPTTADHVLADLDGRIDAVLDGGSTAVGLESTVLDPAPTPMVLYRPGAVTAESIFAATGITVEVFVPREQTGDARQESLPSPGVGMRHYAPKARLLLIEGEEAALAAAIGNTTGSGLEGTGVLLPDGWSTGSRNDLIVENWGLWSEPEQLAAKLFAALRSFDDRGAGVVFVPLPPSGGFNEAIRDRLLKAARRA